MSFPNTSERDQDRILEEIILNFLKIFVCLAVLGRSCAVLTELQHVGSSSLTRDRTQALSIGSRVLAMDHPRNPSYLDFSHIISLKFWSYKNWILTTESSSGVIIILTTKVN